MLFDVTAKQSGNSVKYQIEIPGDDLKDALSVAVKEAKRIFDYKVGIGIAEPTVSIKRSKDDYVKVED